MARPGQRRSWALATATTCIVVALIWLLVRSARESVDPLDRKRSANTHGQARGGDPVMTTEPSRTDVAVANTVAEAEPAVRASAVTVFFNATLPPGATAGELECTLVGTRGQPFREFGSLSAVSRGSPAPPRANLRLTCHRAFRELRIEIRTRDHHHSSGVFALVGYRFEESTTDLTTAEVVSIELRPVGRAEIRVVDVHGAPIDVTPGVNRYRTTTGWNSPPIQKLRSNGSPLLFRFAGVTLEGTTTSSLNVERWVRNECEIAFHHPSYEPTTTTLRMRPGTTTRHEQVLHVLPIAGTFSGRVISASGQSPNPFGLKGAILIRSVDRRDRKFHIGLEWNDGSATWTSPPLPHGEYELRFIDTGPFHVTPHENLTLTPPRRNVDWTWNDLAERRDIGLEVFDAETGERLHDRVRVETFFNSANSSTDWLRDSGAIRTGIPVDSPWRWEVHAPGYRRSAVRIADFRIERKAKVHQQAAPTTVWFARVDLVKDLSAEQRDR